MANKQIWDGSRMRAFRDKEFLTQERAAEYLGYATPETIRRLEQDRRIKPVKGIVLPVRMLIAAVESGLLSVRDLAKLSRLVRDSDF